MADTARQPLGLAERWQDDSTTDVIAECRLWRWLSEFASDDREFLITKLEERNLTTDSLIIWLRRQGITPTSPDALNGHRKRRCACPEEYPGRRY